ncbi:hypothetical protein CH296_28090 [Rhodococcus sp. 14-2496-1d]|uniref:head decoration protein n=1 Tax=Rhodococcus sp. 14-2496-1d TaxID=2023146 RepID=UPI000B9C6E77|nr:head decoration protein [Rhodococcus sp. 14-2496-1d]OZF25178.1 hypothetical protein CH296_28090 [Rhodococcus sp. 14-2496-1d]
MTSIEVQTNPFQNDNKQWLLSPHGTDPGTTPSITLDVSAFTQATHYPNGFIVSGIVLGKITANRKYGPYDDTATDGRQTAAGILFAARKVPNLLDLTKDVGSGLLVHGFVDPAKLPIANAATGGGFLDTNARTDLRMIHFAS